MSESETFKDEIRDSFEKFGDKRRLITLEPSWIAYNSFIAYFGKHKP